MGDRSREICIAMMRRLVLGQCSRELPSRARCTERWKQEKHRHGSSGKQTILIYLHLIYLQQHSKFLPFQPWKIVENRMDTALL